MRPIQVISLALLAVATVAAEESTALYETADSGQIVTPHISWAKPLWGPKPKVLFILMGGGTREAYELAQRMDMELDVFGTTKYWIFAPTSDYYNEGIPLLEERLAQIREMFAKNPDVIVVGSIRMSCFPREVMYEILRRVTDGAALITCNSESGQDLNRLGRNIAKQILSQPVGHLSSILAGVTWGHFHRTSVERTERFRLATKGSISYGHRREPMVLGRAVAYRVGKGLYVQVSPFGPRPGYSVGPTIGPSVPVDFDDLIETEYFYSLVLKTIRWASPRCRPPARISGVEPNCAVLSLGSQPGEQVSLRVAFENTGELQYRGELRSAVRDRTRRVLAETRQPITLPPGSTRMEVQLPAPAAGRCWADHWLLVDGKVMDWGSSAFEARTQCVVRIQSLRDPTRRANLYGRALVNSSPPGAVLRMECEDAYARVLGRRDFPLPDGGGEVTFHFFHGAGPEAHHFLNARVVAPGSGRVLAGDRRPLAIPPSTRDEYYVYSTGGCVSSWLGHQRARLVRALGTDGQRGDTGSIAGYVGIRPGPFFTHVGGCGYKGIASLNDETGYRRQLDEGLRAMAQNVEPLGGHIFNLGDDTGVSKGICKVQPYWCQKLRDELATQYKKKVGDLNAAWGAKLKNFKSITVTSLAQAKLLPTDFGLLKEAWRQEYGGISSMNCAWQTDFHSWDEVTPGFLREHQWVSPCWRAYIRFLKRELGTPERIREEWGVEIKSWDEITPEKLLALRAEGNLVPWISYLWFQEDSYVSILALAGHAVRSVIPDAAIGQDASAFENILPEVLQHANYFCPYYRITAIEKMRSFARLPGRYGACIGVYGGKAIPEAVRRHQPINVAFAGGNTTMFWAMSYGLHGDFTMAPNRAGYMWESIYELKQGLGNLLVRAQRRHSGIALLHSRASGHAQQIDRSMADVGTSQVHFQAILEVLGLQYNYVSTLDIQEGVLDSGDYRVLILPYCQAITDEEARRIATFAKGGGSVIADLRPGVLNRYCRRVTPGQLDSLFGIERRDLAEYRVTGTLEGVSGLAEGLKVENIAADASVAPTEGKALAKVAGAACCILNQTGRGRAVLLNWFVGRYKGMLDQGDLSLRPFYRALLKECGVARRIRVAAQNQDVIGAEVIEFQLGPTTLLCLDKAGYASERFPMDATAKLPEQTHVYDVRAGKPLGHTDAIAVTFHALSQHVFALMPYEISEVRLPTPKRVAQGETLRLRASLRQKDKADFGPHLIRFRMWDPQGQEIVFRRRKVWAEDGQCRVDYHIAYNERLGKYRLEAVDVLTGVRTERELEVIAK